MWSGVESWRWVFGWALQWRCSGAPHLLHTLHLTIVYPSAPMETLGCSMFTPLPWRPHTPSIALTPHLLHTCGAPHLLHTPGVEAPHCSLHTPSTPVETHTCSTPPPPLPLHTLSTPGNSTPQIGNSMGADVFVSSRAAGNERMRISLSESCCTDACYSLAAPCTACYRDAPQFLKVEQGTEKHNCLRWQLYECSTAHGLPSASAGTAAIALHTCHLSPMLTQAALGESQ